MLMPGRWVCLLRAGAVYKRQYDWFHSLSVTKFFMILAVVFLHPVDGLLKNQAVSNA